MTYRQRLSLLILIDSLIVLTTVFFSRFLVSADFNVITFPIVVSAMTLLFSHHIFSFIYKLYKKAWEYASVGELLIILKAITISVITTAVVQQILVQDIYFRLLVVTWMIHILLIGGSRFLWRMFRDAYIQKGEDKKRTLIIGAGSAGTMVVRQLLNSNDTELLPVAFIDDNIKKQGLDILGIPVIGGIDRIEFAVQQLDIDSIIIAIPSLKQESIKYDFQECSKIKIKTQILPMLEDLVTGKVSVNEFRDVQVDDLLGRDPVELDIESISELYY